MEKNRTIRINIIQTPMTLNSTDLGDTVQTGAACLWLVISAIWQEKEWDPRQQWCTLLYRDTYPQPRDLKVTVHPKINHHLDLYHWKPGWISLFWGTQKRDNITNLLFGGFNTIEAHKNAVEFKNELSAQFILV